MELSTPDQARDRLVLAYLHSKRRPVRLWEIVRDTGLPRPTVRAAVGRLITAGHIQDIPATSSEFLVTLTERHTS